MIREIQTPRMFSVLSLNVPNLYCTVTASACLCSDSLTIKSLVKNAPKEAVEDGNLLCVSYSFVSIKT